MYVILYIYIYREREREREKLPAKNHYSKTPAPCEGCLSFSLSFLLHIVHCSLQIAHELWLSCQLGSSDMHTVHSGLWSKCTCKRSDYEMNKNYSTVSLQRYLNESKRVCACACACLHVCLRERKGEIQTLMVLLKFLWFLFFIYLRILSFLSSSEYRPTLTLDSSIRGGWFPWIPCNKTQHWNKISANLINI